jgi:hypothetical protein
MVEEEMTTIRGLHFKNIPWIHAYHRVCNLSWTCFNYIINIHECDSKLFTILYSETLWNTLISAFEVIPMSENCNVFKMHTIFCALQCYCDCSNGNRNRCGLPASTLTVTEVMIPGILLYNWHENCNHNYGESALFFVYS